MEGPFLGRRPPLPVAFLQLGCLEGREGWEGGEREGGREGGREGSEGERDREGEREGI